MARFELVSEYKPKGDQPQAIEKLTKGILSGMRYQTLVGVTGSGKTFTMANVIANVGLPTLVISHNKTLAAQLYGEFLQFFPKNAVHYFISYYDYYQPEAYIPQTDTYIEKDASINDEIERLKLAATSALLERDDVIVVASVSCIYGIGSPREFKEMFFTISRGSEMGRRRIVEKLISLQYERSDFDLYRGAFRARGDVIEVFPAQGTTPVRIQLFGDEVERITEIDPLKGNVLKERDRVVIYPAKHWVTTEDKLRKAIESIEAELEERLAELRAMGKLVEAQRLESRTRFDIEMLKEVGYCQGIENYSRHLDGRMPGERPACLLDYFPDDFLIFIDESHVTVPQLRGMWYGDRSRKEVLVEYGFRLPSALDNRPLKFEEFEELAKRIVFVSATPGPYELSVSEQVVEQIIRPTGLVDPKITVKPSEGQIDDLVSEIRKRIEKGQRVLVTTLTKRMAEDLAEYLADIGIKVHYLHSEIEPIERVEILRDLRLGKYNVVVGVNLLREGLDLPEVSLVAILDADKEGFLRSETSLIQVCGRAARNIDGEVIMYADRITESMKRAIEETNRRREIQIRYNEEHGITPQTITKTIEEILKTTSVADVYSSGEKDYMKRMAMEALGKVPDDISFVVAELERRMREAAKKLEFETAAMIRDQIKEIKEKYPNLSQVRGRRKRRR